MTLVRYFIYFRKYDRRVYPIDLCPDRRAEPVTRERQNVHFGH